MRALNRFAAIALGAAVLLAAGAAEAATYVADVQIGNRERRREASAPLDVILRDRLGGFALAAASSRGVRATVDADFGGVHIAQAGYEELYRVVGPAADLVPVFVRATVLLVGEVDFRSTAGLGVVQDDAAALDLDYVFARDDIGERRVVRRFNVVQRVLVAPNADFLFTLDTYARSRRGEASARVAQVRLTLDPTFIGPYQLYKAADLPTAGAVPEPATWVVMILGFGLAGASLRAAAQGRRRYSVRVAPPSVGVV